MQDDNGCWNCRHFLYEDTDGIGWCEPRDKKMYCGCDACHLWKEREIKTERVKIKTERVKTKTKTKIIQL